jgi:hypothetical protein
MEFISFNSWLKNKDKTESVTSTGDVAHFAQRLPIGMTTRKWPLSIDDWEEEKERKQNGKKDKKNM